MDRRHHDEAKAPPQGEWAVFHERPFPKRLDRAFRIAAIGAGCALLAVGIVAGLYGAATGGGMKAAGVGLTLGALTYSLAYAAIRATGLIVTSLYGLTRRKEYVLDWSGPEDAQHQGGLTRPDIVAAVLAFGSIFLGRAVL